MALTSLPGTIVAAHAAWDQRRRGVSTVWVLLGLAFYDAFRKLLTLGVRFGEADSPGPTSAITFNARMAYHYWPRMLVWDGNTVHRMVCSEAVVDYLNCKSELLVPPVYRRMIMDSGANILFTSFVTQVYRPRKSDKRWDTANSSEQVLDFEGTYLLFIPDHEKKQIRHAGLECLGSAALGSTELMSANQLNAHGVGFCSPPATWGPHWGPHLFTGDSPARVEILHNCTVGLDRLPLIENVHTPQMLQLLKEKNYTLVSLATGEALDPSDALPHVFHHGAGVHADRAITANPDLQECYYTCTQYSNEYRHGIVTKLTALLASAFGPNTHDDTIAQPEITGQPVGPQRPTIEDCLKGISDEQLAELFRCAMEEGEYGTAMKLLKGKQQQVHLWNARLMFLSADLTQSILEHSEGHNLRPTDMRLLLPVLSRWRASLRKRRVGRKSTDPEHNFAPLTSWSCDIHTWPVRSYPHGFKYAVVFRSRKRKMRFVYFIKQRSEMDKALKALWAYVRRTCALLSQPPGLILQHVWSDQEGALYNDNTCQRISKELGFVIEACPKDLHELNSGVEHDQWMLEQMTNAALNFSGAPVVLWPFPYLQAARILNIKPEPSELHPDTGRTLCPYEAAFPGQPINISNYRTCLCPIRACMRASM